MCPGGLSYALARIVRELASWPCLNKGMNEQYQWPLLLPAKYAPNSSVNLVGRAAYDACY